MERWSAVKRILYRGEEDKELYKKEGAEER
jgi:hypothetical protein